MTDHIAAIRKALEAGPTPGEWKSVSRPDYNNGCVYTSIQPVAPDEEATKQLGMMNGEYHVCRMNHTAAEWRFSYHRRNAAFIAACNPVAIAALLVELDHLRAANRLLEKQRNDADTYGDEQYAAEWLRSELKEAFGEGK